MVLEEVVDELMNRGWWDDFGNGRDGLGEEVVMSGLCRVVDRVGWVSV